MGLQLGSKVAFLVALALWCAPAQAQQYTEKNQPWQPGDRSACFVIMKHNKNCLKCFNEVFEALRKDFPAARYSIASLSLVDSSVFARKLEAASVRELMPEASPLLFEYRSKNENPNSLFQRYSPDVTPAIIVMSKGRQIYIPYDSIYPHRKINTRLKGLLQKSLN